MSGKRKMSIRTRRAVSGYLFILPFIIGFLCFMLVPLCTSLKFSLSDVKLVMDEGYTSEWNNYANYHRALQVDPEFNRLLIEEAGVMITHSIATLVVAFVIAIILNQDFKGRAFVRAIFFLPVILSSGALVGLESNNTLMQGMQDMVSETTPFTVTDSMMEILRLTGIGGSLLDVIFDLIAEVYDIVMASGIQIVVFLSGLQNVPASLYEAADVEGCTKWEAFWTITFPMVSPLLIVNIIYTIVDFFTRSDSEVLKKIQETMNYYVDYGFAAAMSWLYFGVSIAIIGIATLILSKGVVNYDAQQQ